MNGLIPKHKLSHQAIISLGSNIDPERNTFRALSMLSKWGKILKVSSVWETKSIDTDGPNFLNASILFQTDESLPDLKDTVLRSIENDLGRIRVTDKNAPRTIDLDIILFDENIVDPQIFYRYYLAKTISEILPEFHKPNETKTLKQIALELGRFEKGFQRKDIDLCKYEAS